MAGGIPEYWDVFRVRRVARRIQTGTTPPTAVEEYYADGDVPWYGPGAFGVDLALAAPERQISEVAVREGMARSFEPESTYVVTIGATLGKVGFS